MSDLATSIYTPEQVRELDRIVISELGIPGYTLMSRAGHAVFDVARQRYPVADRWLILCGAGNNAGDGYVVARLAVQAGLHVTVAALSDPHRLQGDAAMAWQDFQRAGGGVVQFSHGLCAEADLTIDALLGTGLQRTLEGAWLHAVESVNAAGRPVIAVDIPSGLDGATGAVMGAAVNAAITVTFIGRKLGLYVGAGSDHAGEIVFADLAAPPGAANRLNPVARLFTQELLAGLMPRRSRTGHKGSYGHVLVIGGNHGMAGAARLAGEAALRAGAGLVSVATLPANVATVAAARPELMVHCVSGAADLQTLLARATVIAIGPGLGRDAWARELLQAILRTPHPKVLDADALNVLAEQPVRRDDWILTPHPGEAGRLLGQSAAEIQRDRLAAVTTLAARYGGVALLKGRNTLVAQTGHDPFMIDRGNPGMATGGMGDVLSGVVAGVLAQRPATDMQQMVAAAAFVHASAADLAARAGERGLIASDLFAHLRSCVNPCA
jgi:NAD(P)H-hydrate epimerase